MARTRTGHPMAALRRHWGLTQIQMGIALGVHPITVSKVERRLAKYPRRCAPWVKAMTQADAPGYQRISLGHYLTPDRSFPDGRPVQFWVALGRMNIVIRDRMHEG